MVRLCPRPGKPVLRRPRIRRQPSSDFGAVCTTVFPSATVVADGAVRHADARARANQAPSEMRTERLGLDIRVATVRERSPQGAAFPRG